MLPLALASGECQQLSQGSHKFVNNASATKQSEQWRSGGMNLTPLGDRLIVEPLEEEQTTIGGIVLPDTAVEKPQRGSVVAAGPGARNSETGDRIEMDVAAGDT